MKKLTKILSLIFIFFALVDPNIAFSSFLSDIPNHKNYQAIQYLYDNKIISGYPDGTFQSDRIVNRAELLKILVAGKGINPQLLEYKNCFKDVKEEWFAPYICYAKTKEWIQGYPDGSFKPTQEINKAEAIKMLINSQEYPLEAANSSYEDVLNNAWFAPFVDTARTKGLLEEYEKLFEPNKMMTRAMISENLYRAIIINKNQLQSFNEYKDKLFLVDDVIDGDTIETIINYMPIRIRLIGVNTPEITGYQCFGKEASEITEKTLSNKYIRLEVDDSQGDKDKYGRLLRYIFLVNDLNFNKWLIEEGYGLEYTYNTAYKYQGDFKKAQLDAQNAKKGLWAENTCNGRLDTPQKTNYVFYVSSKAKTKYYCETDLAWESLSQENLLKYDSEEVLKKDFPGLVLNKPCE